MCVPDLVMAMHSSTRRPGVARVSLMDTESSFSGRFWRRANEGMLSLLAPVFNIDRAEALYDANGPNRIWFIRSSEGDDVASGQEGRFVQSFRFIMPRTVQPREYLPEYPPTPSIGFAARVAKLGWADEQGSGTRKAREEQFVQHMLGIGRVVKDCSEIVAHDVPL